MIRHSTISTHELLEYVLYCEHARKQQVLIERDSIPLSNAEAIASLRAAIAAGVNRYGCPEPLADGACPGHSE